MKTELQIAKENIGLECSVSDNFWKVKSLEHKKSCERFLEFLDMNIDVKLFGKKIVSKNVIKFKLFKDKITDLKQAIKLYEE